MSEHVEGRFRAADRLVFWALFLVVLCVAVVIAAGEIRPSDDWLHRAGTWSAALGVSALFALVPLLAFPTLEMLGDGLRYRVPGVWSRKVAWSEVTRVHCCDVSSRRFIGREYRLFVAGRDDFPRLTVRSDYDGIEQVIAVMQAEMTARHVPMFIRKNGWPATTDRLPFPSEAPKTLWSLQ
ncbi:hypothetical protein KPL74_11625 [Bacillus sp. NP157]|nr:hypothetical protein KPL74_11625 [Bacillus sp. NP157]